MEIVRTQSHVHTAFSISVVFENNFFYKSKQILTKTEVKLKSRLSDILDCISRFVIQVCKTKSFSRFVKLNYSPSL